MNDLKDDVNRAGKVLNKAKEQLEDELRRPIVTSENYIDLTEKEKLIEHK